MPRKIFFNHSKKLNPVTMMVICGSTNSGKTHLLFELITKGIWDFEHLQIFTTTSEQIYYQLLKHGFRNHLSKEMIYNLFQLYSQDEEIEIEHIPALCEHAAKQMDEKDKTNITINLTDNLNELNDLSKLNPKKKNGIIFDDCVNEKDQSFQKMCFTKGRHQSCSCIYLTQSFYGLDSDIRKNANCFVLFGMNSRSLVQVLQDIDVGNSQEFKRIANMQWNDPSEHKYVFVNIDKPMRERVITNLFD